MWKEVDERDMRSARKM